MKKNFTSGQVVQNIETAVEYTIVLQDAKLKNCNGGWTSAYVYTDEINYYVRDKSDMEDKFEALLPI